MAVEPPVPTGPTQPPNNTVYVRNLEETIKIETLTNALTELFESYGTILEIIAKRSISRKGQAFIVFEDADAAATAIEEIQGFDLFEKPMHLDFAKTKSDAIIKLSGNENDLEAHKRKRMAEKERKQAAAEADRAQKEKLKRPPPGETEDSSKPKTAKLGGGLKSTAKTSVVPDEYLPPNKILFLQNVQEGYGVDELSAIFRRFEGFKEVRMVPTRPGLAFVEYAAEAGAISAKEATAGMALGDGGKVVKVTFQRK